MNLIRNILSVVFLKPLRLTDVLELSKQEDCFFEDLKTKLKHTTLKITETRKVFFFAKFIEKNSEYLICFTSNGKFYI
jgi:hypothetical protein